MIFNNRLKTVTEELEATRQSLHQYKQNIDEKDLKITEEEGRVQLFENKYRLADEQSKQNQKHVEELIDIVERNKIVSKLVIITAGFRFMGLNANFNNISATSWLSALLMEKTRVPRENHRTIANH